MRIVFIMSTSVDRPFGGGRWLPLLSELARQGHEIHIAALHHDWSASVPRVQQIAGVTVHYVGQMHVRIRGETTSYFSLPRLLWVTVSGTAALLARALLLRGDLYHIGKPHPQSSTAGLLAATLLRRPVFLDTDDFEAGANRFGSSLQRQVAARLERFVPRRVRGVTTHSQFLIDYLTTLRVPPEHILRLPNTIAPARRDSPEATADIRSKLAIPPSAPVVAYVGTLSLSNHPVDLLIDAFVHVAASLPDARLLLVGAGHDRAALENLARLRGIAAACHFVGRVAPDEIIGYYQMAAVTVDPVHDDAVGRARWPLKIMESVGAEVPVITGDVGDRQAMLGDGRAGLVVPAGDSQALADAIVQVLKDPALRAALVAGCRIQAKSYTTVSHAARLIAFYRSRMTS